MIGPSYVSTFPLYLPTVPTNELFSVLLQLERKNQSNARKGIPWKIFAKARFSALRT